MGLTESMIVAIVLTILVSAAFACPLLAATTADRV